jgi:uncharacterized protein (TIGR03086 family)
MTNQLDEILYFPATAPAACADPAVARDLIAPVLAALADVVEVPERAVPDVLDAPTPCRSYTVATLRDHVLGWLQFFAAAMQDPDRAEQRLDPDAYRASEESRPLGDVVRASARGIDQALDAGVLDRQVVMSQSRMDGPAVLGMALGEYVVHGWDLATATGRPWTPSAQACEVALEFFTSMVAPEYRSEDGAGGFFGPEVPVPADAPALDRLLGFAGRDPHWTSAVPPA